MEHLDSSYGADGAHGSPQGDSPARKFTWNAAYDDSPLVELKKECDDTVSAAGVTCAGASTTASRMRYSNPEETLIFLDWDDTVFPTTDLFNRWGLSSRMDWDDVRLSEEQ